MDTSKVTEQLQTQVDSAKKQIQSAVEESGRKLTELRQKAPAPARQGVRAPADRATGCRRGGGLQRDQIGRPCELLSVGR